MLAASGSTEESGGEMQFAGNPLPITSQEQEQGFVHLWENTLNSREFLVGLIFLAKRDEG